MAIPKQEPQDAALPPVPPPSPKERADALKALTAQRRAAAWSVHRWPLERRAVPVRTRVHLPRAYLGAGGEDVRVVYAGTDLNVFVHEHYMAPVERTAADSAGANYVAPEGIGARRHEFLGPDPRVAGYFTDVGGDVHVKWWDAFLQDQWMGKQKWRFDVRLDGRGCWVEKDD